MFFCVWLFCHKSLLKQHVFFVFKKIVLIIIVLLLFLFWVYYNYPIFRIYYYDYIYYYYSLQHFLSHIFTVYFQQSWFMIRHVASYDYIYIYLCIQYISQCLYKCDNVNFVKKNSFSMLYIYIYISINSLFYLRVSFFVAKFVSIYI